MLVPVLASTTDAFATTYRCEHGGTTTYSDRPCAVGKQSVADVEMQGPTAADSAAAAARARSDKAAAEALQRNRERRERDVQVASRGRADRAKEESACAKLATRSRRAHEDYDTAALKDQAKQRVRMRRADEDYAASCKKR